MQSLQWTTGVITLAMLLNVCQLGTSSPAGSRPETRNIEMEVNKTMVHASEGNITNEITTEDPIIDEATLNLEGRKLHPRMRLLQKIKTAVDPNGSNDVLKTIDTILLTKRANESDLNEELSFSESNIQNATNSDIKNDAAVEVEDGHSSTLQPLMELHQTNKIPNIDLSIMRNTNTSASNDNSLLTKLINITDNANVHPNTSNLQKKINTENEQNVELSPEDKLFLKHSHLTNFLFGSLSNGDLPKTNENLKADQEPNIKVGEQPLSRMITEPDNQEGKTVKQGFQDRSDMNLTGITSHDEITVDRSFEIDASVIEDDVNVHPPNTSSNDNKILEGNPNESKDKLGEDNQERSGFLHFLKSLFGF